VLPKAGGDLSVRWANTFPWAADVVGVPLLPEKILGCPLNKDELAPGAAWGFEPTPRFEKMLTNCESPGDPKLVTGFEVAGGPFLPPGLDD
jgi:hypothetical protein